MHVPYPSGVNGISFVLLFRVIIILVGHLPFSGKLAVVRVDSRGRLTIPKELGVRVTKAIIIGAGSFFIAIPLPKTPFLIKFLG